MRVTMHCYICKAECGAVKSLIAHLNVLHDLNANSTYTCIEPDCGRTFSSTNSFRSHIKLEHNTQYKKTKQISSNGQSQEIDVLRSTSSDRIDDTESIFIESLENDSESHAESSSNVDDFSNIVQSQFLGLVAKLYGKSTLPRNHVQFVVDQIGLFINAPLQAIKQKVIDVFHSNGVDAKEEADITRLFEELGISTSIANTEYLHLKYLRNTGYLVEPVAYTIGEAFENKSGIMTPIARKGQHIPLRIVLKHFLEIPNVFNDIKNYVQSLEKHNSVISNIIQADLWKKKASVVQNLNPSACVLPLVMYFDDYETGNCLGSHSGIHKLGAAYVSLPAVPQPFQGSLNNIFLAALFHSSDHKEFGNKMVFSRLIDEFNYLETVGVHIQTSLGDTHVIFVLILIIGDNLGLNTILGFTAGFRGNYFCRICKVFRTDAEKLTVEDKKLMRNRVNYDLDVKTDNVSETGVKECCVFNGLPSYHVVENCSVDIMHDLLEGVCAYEMSLIFHQFIMVDKIITLEEFNSKLASFDFQFETSRPPLSTYDNVKSKHLRMSASEMLCFCRYTGIIFGDVIPEDNAFWSLYLQLRRILCLIMSKYFDLDWCEYLRTLITEHHEMYLRYGGKLKPKHHYMLHYPDLIKHVGPLVHIWSMRYESKHHESKLSSNSVSGRINISKTVALKHQLKVCDRFISRQGFDSGFSSGVTRDLNDSLPRFVFEYLVSNHSGQRFSITNWVKMYNTIYKRDYALLVDVDDGLPTFGNIQNILINVETKEILFHCQVYHTHSFNEHLSAYRVTITNTPVIIQQSQLIEYHPQLFVANVEGNSYIVSTYNY